MRILIWGTGSDAMHLWEYAINCGVANKSIIVAFCDSDTNKIGHTSNGLPVISANEIEKYYPDYLVIGSRKYYQEIKKIICEERLFDKEKVITIDVCKRIFYALTAYDQRYNGERSNKKNHQYNNITVYTAITGNYDSIKEPAFVSPGIKYICFTNNRKLNSEIWDMRYIDSELNNISLARKIKIKPWEFMEDYSDICIWVDGKFKIMDDLREYCLEYLREQPMLCFPHFERDNICDEVAELIKRKPEIKKDVIIQAAAYFNEGFMDDIGLYETGCIVRDISNEKVKNLMNLWWNELVDKSMRDQISLPYLCWKTAFKPDICDQYIANNRWLTFFDHNYSN